VDETIAKCQRFAVYSSRAAAGHHKFVADAIYKQNHKKARGRISSSIQEVYVSEFDTRGFPL
jgi:hypothetical protein